MIYIRNNRLWIKDDIFMPAQAEPITQPAQTTKFQIAASDESCVLKIEIQDRVCKHAWPIIIEQKYT